MSKPTLALVLVPAVLAASASSGVLAEPIPTLDAFRIAVGGYHSDYDISVRSDRGTIRGTDVSFRRDLGLGDRDTAVTWEAATTLFNRHQFKAFGHHYSADGQRRLTRDLQIGDEDFPVDADFNGDLRIGVHGASYTWFFHDTGSNAFGIGIGALRYDLRASLNAQALIDEIPVTIRGRISEYAWAPMLRAEYIQLLGHSWRLHADLAAVRKPSGSVTGNAIDASVGLDWFPWRNLGLSARYRYNDIDLDLDKTRFSGNIDVRTHGPQLLAALRF